MLQPKFDFLNALAVGHTDSVNNYILSLQSVINKHKNHEVSVKANEILSYLLKKPKEENPGKKEGSEKPKIEFSIYKYEASKPHVFLATYSDSKIKTPYLLNSIAQFNSRSFSMDELKVSSLVLQILVLNQDGIILFRDNAEGQQFRIKFSKNLLVSLHD